jgi:hypothetical protein
MHKYDVIGDSHGAKRQVLHVILLGREVPSFLWNMLPKSSAKKRAFLAGRWQQQVRPKS